MSNKAKFEEALAKLPEEYKGFEDSLRQLFDVADQKMPEQRTFRSQSEFSSAGKLRPKNECW